MRAQQCCNGNRQIARKVGRLAQSAARQLRRNKSTSSDLLVARQHTLLRAVGRHRALLADTMSAVDEPKSCGALPCAPPLYRQSESKHTCNEELANPSSACNKRVSILEACAIGVCARRQKHESTPSKLSLQINSIQFYFFIFFHTQFGEFYQILIP